MSLDFEQLQCTHLCSTMSSTSSFISMDIDAEGPVLPVSLIFLGTCPEFGQDTVNFHRDPGRGTAGWADPTWPNRAEYSIPCALMLGSSGGELGGGNTLVVWERAALVWSRRAALWVMCGS